MTALEPTDAERQARQARIRALVDQAPELTDRQIDRLRGIVAGHRDAEQGNAIPRRARAGSTSR